MGIQEAAGLYREAMQAVGKWTQGYANEAILGLLGAVLLILAFALRQRKKRIALSNRISMIKSSVCAVKPSKSVEHNLNALLELLGGAVEASSYAFYVYDDRNKVYVLKAVRHRAEEHGKIRPSYSGLKPFNMKEAYIHPLSIAASNVGDHVGIVKDGEVPLIQVPVAEKLGVIIFGPMGGRLRKQLKALLEELSSSMGHGLGFMLDKEKATTQADVVISSGRALQKISNIALDPNVTVELMLELSIKAVGAASGCFVRKIGNEFKILAAKNLDTDLQMRLAEDHEFLSRLHETVGTDVQKVLRRGQPSFYTIPPYMAATGLESLTVTQVDGPNQFIFYGHAQTASTEDVAGDSAALHMIMGDVRELVGYQTSLRQLSSTYTSILKKLSQLLDNLSPYTVGYSEQMSRYSIIIAQQMGLSEDAIRDVALAAYLSNIGVLGISTDLYQKEGKYTDKEFELMKLHAEVGASIVKVTTGNERAASYIMHHHERMDGNGYPAGLKGDDIPDGAKIIAVVQTFLAKINGRPYRDPLPFSQALKTLKSATGSQLDPNIVRTFIDWFQEKQRNPNFNARSLGSCWEMSCSPSSVCEHCPAYRRTDVNCWDVPGNNCRAHGKQCDTCFVRTEVTTRKEAMNL